MTLQAFRFDLLNCRPLPRRCAARYARSSTRIAIRSAIVATTTSVQPQDGRARLDWHDMAEAVWRHERSAFERYVLIEEMLAAGAPVGFH
jgi:hypothetical protein